MCVALFSDRMSKLYSFTSKYNCWLPFACFIAILESHCCALSLGKGAFSVQKGQKAAVIYAARKSEKPDLSENNNRGNCEPQTPESFLGPPQPGAEAGFLAF